MGTTHVDKLSVQRVRKAIAETSPSVVAVELCEERLEAMRDPERGKLGTPLSSGLLPWLLALLERAVGSLTDVFPGSEMLEAVEEAERAHAQVVMIDKPISSILDDLRKIPALERFRIAIDVLEALLKISTRQGMTTLRDANLDKMLTEFDSKYPTLSQVLVKARDQYMADRLREILNSTSGQIVAVVGLGHAKGIRQLLAKNEQGAHSEPSQISYVWTAETFAW